MRDLWQFLSARTGARRALEHTLSRRACEHPCRRFANPDRGDGPTHDDATNEKSSELWGDGNAAAANRVEPLATMCLRRASDSDPPVFCHCDSRCSNGNIADTSTSTEPTAPVLFAATRQAAFAIV